MSRRLHLPRVRTRRRISVSGFVLALTFLLALPGAARLVPLGETTFPELPANGFVGLAPLAGRGVVVAWIDQESQVLRARELEANLGQRREFVVVDTRGGPPTLLVCPQVARMGQGRLVFAWGAVSAGSLRSRIAYRVMNEDGTPRSPVRFVQSDPAHLDQGCPRLGGGESGFAIAWARQPAGTSHALRARTFSLRGAPTSPPIDLDTSEGNVIPPEVVVDRDGSFVAAWTRVKNVGEVDLHLGRFARDGRPVGRSVLAAADAREGSIVLAADSGFGFEVFWNASEPDLGRSVNARIFDPSLRPISPVRSVYTATGQFALPVAAVDRSAGTALLFSDSGVVFGLGLDRSLQPRCGATSRVSDDLPQGSFPVVVSNPGEVVVAGVEAKLEPYRPRLIVRRYRVGGCQASP